MGLGSFLKKATKAFTFGALGASAFDSLLGKQDNDLARQQEAAMRQQAEALKLQNANSAFENVVTFEDGGTNTAGVSDMRRKKQATGSYASGLGAQV